MLKIDNLSAKVENKSILDGLNLNIRAGEIHAIMGPNGSGKSTLANILSGKKGYEISGKITYDNMNLLDLEIEERAHKGLFLAFQYPLEIPGVNTSNFLKTSLNAIRKSNGQKELDAFTSFQTLSMISTNMTYTPIFKLIELQSWCFLVAVL